MNYVVIDAENTGYSPKQVANRAMTVGELIKELKYFDPEDKVILSFDNGYTYGALRSANISSDYEDDEDEF